MVHYRRAVLLVLAPLLCAGCVFVTPFPSVGNTGLFKSIDKDTVSFIQPGLTTLEDVLLQLGAPDEVTGDTLSYFIERRAGIGIRYGIWFGYGGIGTTILRRRRYDLEVTVNASDTVTAIAFTRPVIFWEEYDSHPHRR